MEHAVGIAITEAGESPFAINSAIEAYRPQKAVTSAKIDKTGLDGLRLEL
jgi:hypothetical protein